MWYKASGTTLYQELESLRPQMACVAQAVYEEWDAESEDDEEDATGVSEIISESISEIISENITDIHLAATDDDKRVIAYNNDEAYVINIPTRMSNSISWLSRPDIAASDIEIKPIDIVDVDYHSED